MNEDDKRKIKIAWRDWGAKKPWYCPKCDLLLNMEYFPICCGGSHPYKPTFGHVPTHEPIEAKRSVTFEEFCTIMYKFLV